MTTRRGTMPTERPERYAKQLAGHWSRKGTVTEDGDVTVIVLEGGNEARLHPVDGGLDIEATVPDGGDADRWAQVVAEHLQRFGQRDELVVAWEAPAG